MSSDYGSVVPNSGTGAAPGGRSALQPIRKEVEEMHRNIRTLGLTLVAVLAMSAVVTAAAGAAQGKLTSDGPVTLDMTERGGEVNAFTAFGAKVECPGTIRTGHKTLTTKETEEGKKHELIPVGSTSYTITEDIPQAECKAIEGGTTHKATVTTNGCDSDVTLGETAGPTTFVQTTDIVCPTGKDIEMEVYPFAGSELGGVACTITVKPQVGLTGATAETNVGAHDLNISGSFFGLAASRSGFGCATEETKTASIDIHITIKGTNSAGGNTGITITD